jgi:hypothetical protein
MVKPTICSFTAIVLVAICVCNLYAFEPPLQRWFFIGDFGNHSIQMQLENLDTYGIKGYYAVNATGEYHYISGESVEKQLILYEHRTYQESYQKESTITRSFHGTWTPSEGVITGQWNPGFLGGQTEVELRQVAIFYRIDKRTPEGAFVAFYVPQFTRNPMLDTYFSAQYTEELQKAYAEVVRTQQFHLDEGGTHPQWISIESSYGISYYSEHVMSLSNTTWYNLLTRIVVFIHPCITGFSTIMRFSKCSFGMYWLENMLSRWCQIFVCKVYESKKPPRLSMEKLRPFHKRHSKNFLLRLKALRFCLIHMP